MPEYQDLIDALKGQHADVGFETSPGVGSEYKLKGPKGQPLKPVVALGKQHANLPHILAHELGHHQVDQSRFGRMLQSGPALAMMRRGSIPLSAAAGIAASQSDSPYAPYLAAAVPLATTAPTLLSELMASHHGMKKLRQAGASSAALSAGRRDLTGALGSYLTQTALAGGAAAAPFLAKKWREHQQSPEEGTPLVNRPLQGAALGAGVGALGGALSGALSPQVYTGQTGRMRGALQTGKTLGRRGVGAGLMAGGLLGAAEAWNRFRQPKEESKVAMASKDKKKKEEPGFLRRHAPELAGGALATLSAPLLYKYLRRKNFSKDPAMRAIQEASGGKYTRVLPGTARMTGDAEKQGPVKKFIDRLMYAGGGDVRYKDELRRTAAKAKGQLPHIPGAVMHDLPGEQLARGNVDLISNRAADEATSHFGNQDKWREYQIFNQFAPGAMAPSSNVRDILSELGYQVGHRNPELRAKQIEAFRKQMASNPRAREEMLNKLQGKLKEKYGPGYMLKDIDAAATGGKFPTDKHRFSDLADQNSPEGKTLTNLIKNPGTVMAQEKLPLEQGTWLDRQFAKIRGLPSSKEVRVHVMNGAVAPDLTVPRFSPTMFLTGRKKMRGAEDFTRDLLGKLPEELRHGTYALDVAPVMGGGYRLIESNPGYRSGLLNPQNYPLTGPLAHRQFTGQWSKPVAGIGAGLGSAALGTAGALGTHAIQQAQQPEEPGPGPRPKMAAMKRKSFGELSFYIDRPKGTVKKWDQPDGSVKKFTYPCDYGYFPRLKGEDGEGLDAFVGDDADGHLESFLKLKKDEKGRMVPDETKFIVGLTDREREVVYRLYGTEAVNRKVYNSVDALQRDLDRFRPAKKGRYQTEKAAALNARPSVDPGKPAGKPLWQLRDDGAMLKAREAEAMRAAAVKTQSGKDIPPVSEIRTRAIKQAMNFYGVKNADIDKILNGVVSFADQGDASSPAHAHGAEAADKADKLDRAFKSFDDRQGAPMGQGTESSVGSMFQGDVVG